MESKFGTSIKIFVRIRKPGEIKPNGKKGEQNQSQAENSLNSKNDKNKSKSPNKVVKSGKAPVSTGKIDKSLSQTQMSNIKESRLNDDMNYTIFTSRDQCGSIICSNLPISGKLINSSFLSEKDLYEYSYSLLKDSTILLYDQVYNEFSKTEQIYSENLKLQVSNLFQGQNSSFFLFGPSESGKSFTLRGEESNPDSGLFSSAIYDILNLIEIAKQGNKGSKKYTNYSLKISIFQIYAEIISDLLSKDTSKDTKVANGIINPTLVSKEINAIKDLDAIIKESIQIRKMLEQSLKVNDLKKKSSVCFSLILEKREFLEGKPNITEKVISPFSRIDFVELASSEIGLPGASNTKGEVFKSTSKIFNSVADNIVSIANQRQAKLDSKLTACLKPTLAQGSSIFFIVCINSAENPLGESFQALKFTNWMRNQILNSKVNNENPIRVSNTESSVQQQDYSDSQQVKLNSLNNINNLKKVGSIAHNNHYNSNLVNKQLSEQYELSNQDLNEKLASDQDSTIQTSMINPGPYIHHNIQQSLSANSFKEKEDSVNN